MPAPLNSIVRYLQRCRRYSLRPHAMTGALVMAMAVAPAIAQTMTTDEAVARARQQVPGKLVGVNKEQQGEQTVYRVRILGADGVVRTVFVNADR